jgi:hypothetical protein
MLSLRRRVQALERLRQLRLPPSPLEQITRLALESLSLPDLELLWVILQEQSEGTQSRESSAREAEAWAAWLGALEAEARRMGFRSFAEAERIAGSSGRRFQRVA